MKDTPKRRFPQIKPNQIIMNFVTLLRRSDDHQKHKRSLLLLLSSIYAVALSMTMSMFIFRPFLVEDLFRKSAIQGISIAMVAAVTSFMLIRARRELVGSMLLVFGNTFGVVSTILTSPNPFVLEKILDNATPWLAFSILVCGLTLGRSLIYATTGSILVICVAITSFMPATLLFDFVAKIIFLATISGIAIVFVIIRDDHLEQEKSNQASLAFSSRMSALGEMAGGIAHEINSPLATIHTLSGQLQDLLEDDQIDLPFVKEMATEIESTSLRISKITSGLRALSRNDSTEPYRPSELTKIIEETLVFCKAKFKSLGVKLLNEIPSTGLQIDCRAAQISQVILNLLNNSCDAVEDLPEKWVCISKIDQGSTVEIAITDSGNGINPSVQKKLFQPYFTTKEIGKGTGIGLGISKKIVESHGGSLTLDSNCRNTRFVIMLPKRQQSHSKQPVAA